MAEASEQQNSSKEMALKAKGIIFLGEAHTWSLLKHMYPRGIPLATPPWARSPSPPVSHNLDLWVVVFGFEYPAGDGDPYDEEPLLVSAIIIVNVF